ncbi:hypothetical protein B4N89_17715 [Embleya scabrispora]|uniref:Lipoprotein n=1 Tax=Embleya scabrispora TaxID=159449 RepID=A0A1T3P085_9ACTN|nr:hypothetical protein [Embleya scabrispora]OPC82529.1 hypothetical protein B4N89_17715 [Embleya scabrispora]
MRPIRISAAALTVPLVLLAAGCGESSSKDPFESVAAGGNALDPKGPSNEGLSVEALSKQAENGYKDLTNLHIEGTGKVYDAPVGVDLRIGTENRAEGKVTVQGKALDLIAVDKAFYVRLAPGTIQTVVDLGKRAEAASPSGKSGSSSRGDKQSGDRFDTMFTEAAKLVEGKYVKFGDTDASKFGQDLLKGGGTPSLDNLFGSDSDSDSDSSDPTDKPKLTKGPITDINGVKTIPLISKDEDGTVSTIYVAANGTPFPVRVTADDKGDGTNEVTIDLKYSKLSGGVSPKAPPAGETIDLNGLLKSFGGGLFGDDKAA